MLHHGSIHLIQKYCSMHRKGRGVKILSTTYLSSSRDLSGDKLTVEPLLACNLRTKPELRPIHHSNPLQRPPSQTSVTYASLKVPNTARLLPCGIKYHLKTSSYSSSISYTVYASSVRDAHPKQSVFFYRFYKRTLIPPLVRLKKSKSF